MYFKVAVWILSFAISVLGSTTHEVHEKLSVVPKHWKRHSNINRDAQVEFKVALTQSNLHLLHEALMNVSDPASPHYGHHWSHKKVVEFFAPSEESFTQVKLWLLKAGIPASSIAHSRSAGIVRFNASIGQAEEIFLSSYAIYQHVEDPKVFNLLTTNYSLPHHVKRHIDFVSPTVQVGGQINRHSKYTKQKRAASEHHQPDANYTQEHRRAHSHKHHLHRKLGSRQRHGASPKGSARAGPMTEDSPTASSESPLQGCETTITPACLRNLYEIPENTHFNPKNGMAVVEYSHEYYSDTDLAMFLKEFTKVPSDTRPIFRAIGSGLTTKQNFPGQDIYESNLDLQYAIPLVYPQPVTLWQVGYLGDDTFNDVRIFVLLQYLTANMKRESRVSFAKVVRVRSRIA